ncbi:MAG: hypothetical protein J6C15_05575 [Bacteroidaceae bacterium]|nr:hypothetical protein [Bacteroidaceae bacterium]
MYRIKRIITTDTDLVSKEQYVLRIEEKEVVLNEDQLTDLSNFLSNYIDNIICLPLDNEEM